ncbi:hypothetical protein REPUB_Repub20aG0128700 [Reevesia pubescens]
METGPWHIQNKSLILKKWEPSLKFLDFILDKLLVWVNLFNEPLELFTKWGLSYISSALGYPLYMDKVTTSHQRLAYARVCVEVDAGKEIPKLIKVKLKNGDFTYVSVEIPWLPSTCTRCKTFGYLDANCPCKPVVANKGVRQV